MSLYGEVSQDYTPAAAFAGVRIEITDPDQTTIYAHGISNDEGTFVIDTSGISDGTPVVVRVVPPLGWLVPPGRAASYTHTIGAPHPPGGFLFWLIACFQPASSWVHRVCWIPAWGVTVQFHDRQFAPYFRCSYPGTTFDHYLAFLLAPSAGRHIWAFYYHRPYIPR